MKSLASALALLVAVGAGAQEPPPGDGPRGTSQGAPGSLRYDGVGRIAVGEAGGANITTDTLPAGSFAEVTALEGGRTIIVGVIAGVTPPGTVGTLSAAAAAILGIPNGAVANVRVRGAVASPQEVVAIRDRGEAPERATAPPALLVALRRKVEATPIVVAAPARSRRGAGAAAPPRAAAPPPQASGPAAARPGYVVQVAAFSSAVRAGEVARSLGGSVLAGPPLWRVRLGPFTAAAAQKARADAVRRGFTAAQIIPPSSQRTQLDRRNP